MVVAQVQTVQFVQVCEGVCRYGPHIVVAQIPESRKNTVKILKIWTPEKFTVITLKFVRGGFTIE